MTKYRFGDIVREVKEKVDRSNNPYEYFIAGDHMDTDELHLLRRGSFKDSDVGPAFIRIFRPGQVLYGSRRTYLRKVAVANFEGVTANTTFVLESKDESVLLQRLLPFIMQSDRFVQHSIKRSKGSTNPYVLFTDLADYEINLPNVEKQKELADLLWTLDDVKMSYKRLISATNDLVKSQFIEQIEGHYSEIALGDEIETTSGGTPSRKKSEYYDEGDIPWLTSGEVNRGIINSVNAFITKLGLENSSAKWVPAGSVVIAMYGATAGAVGLLEVPTTTNQAVCSLLPSEKFDPFYLYQAVCQKREWMIASTNGAAQPNISQTIIKKMRISKPPMEVQKSFSEIVRQSDKSKFTFPMVLRYTHYGYSKLSNYVA